MWLLVPTASAHLPHDPVHSVAIPGDGAAPWFMVSNPSIQSLLLRSDDRGRTWEMVGGEPTQDPLGGVSWLVDGTLVVWAPERLWWSADQGASWSAAAVPGEVVDASGGERLRLATRGGLYGGHPATGFEVEARGSWARVGEDWAVASDGSPWVYEGGAWTARPRLEAEATVLTDGGGWIGDAAGGLWRWTGAAWSPCAALPADPDEQHPSIVALAPDGEGALVAAAWRGPFRAEADCAAWADVHFPVDPVYNETGGVSAEDEAFTFLVSVEGRWAIAGWAGYASSDDAGLTWDEAPLVPADYTRGLAFAPGSDQRVYLGGYGSGVGRTLDGGAGFDAPGAGADAVNVQEAGVPETGPPGQVWAVAGHQPWVSADGGVSWERLARPWRGETRMLHAREGLMDLWTFPVEPAAEGEPGALYSVDGGQTWLSDPALEALLAGAVGRDAGLLPSADGAEVYCVLAHKPVVLACQEGGAWVERLRHEGETAFGPFVGGPTGAPRWVVVDTAGVWRSADAGVSWTAAPVPTAEGVVAAARADDGRLFVATGGGGLLRSDDEGESWFDLGFRLNAPVHVLAPRRGFSSYDDLLVGTHDGIRRVRGAGGAAPELVAWGAWQRIDDLSELLACTGCTLESEHFPGAAMDRVRRVEPGARLHAWLRGETLTVVGASEGGSVVELVVDGAVVGTLGVDPAALGALVVVEGLSPGWHRVELLGVEGSGVRVDALEMRGADVPFEATADPVDTGSTLDTGPGSGPPSSHLDRRGRSPPGCGCAGSGVSAALPLGALLTLRRRRLVGCDR